jgi:hypothetical protein
MKKIKLSNADDYTLVDDEDYPILSRYTWRKDPKGYAVTGFMGTTIRLHRFILNPPKDVQIDHVNCEKLDNRKSNLRKATNTENQRNVKKKTSVNGRKMSSKYKGVNLRKCTGKFIARISVNGERLFLGNFLTEEEAAHAYNEAAYIHFGEFARLNKVI